MKAGDKLPTIGDQRKSRQAQLSKYGIGEKLSTPASGPFEKLPPWHPMVDRVASLPCVRNLLQGNYQKMNGLVWANGSIRDNVEQANEGGYQLMGVDPKERVVEAQGVLATIVEAKVLKAIPSPKVSVVLREDHLHAGVRAYHGETGVVVDVSDEVPIIVHEIAHYLEWHLDALWEAVMALREQRHAWADPRGKRIAVEIPAEMEPRIEERGRFAGDYPATTPYCSKVYDFGATELVSMTLEKLATKETTSELVHADPLLALVVLFHLRPNDKDVYALYEEHRRYLPPPPSWGPFGYFGYSSEAVDYARLG